MRILITNIQLTQRSGTEVVVRDLDAALRGRGHEVCVYTPNRGVMASEIEQAGGTVVTSVDDVPFPPEVIHGHHHVPTVEASVRFPDVPVISVCHSRLDRIDLPPLLPSVHRYVAVDLDCLERLQIDSGIDPGRTTVIHNAVDLDRTAAPRRRAEPPASALLLSNDAGRGGFADVVARACAEVGLPLTVVGAGVGRSEPQPELLLAEHDIVFAKARSALESIASGCAVVVVDDAGLGTMITTSDVATAADWNFGVRWMQRTPTVAAVVDEIRRYDAVDAESVSAWVRANRSLSRAVQLWEELYADALAHRGDRRSSVSWPNALESLLGHAGRLETMIRVGQQHGPIVQAPLSAAAIMNVEVRVLACPRAVEPGQEFDVVVEIDNRSAEPLASIGDRPVNLSSHWSDPATGAWTSWEGMRTALPSPLRTGDRSVGVMRVRAPERCGPARLHPTLVQEFVCWFDSVAPERFPVVDVAVGTRSARPSYCMLASLAAALPLDLRRDAVISGLGFVTTDLDGLLVFAERPTFIDRAVAHRVAAVIVPEELVDRVPASMGILVSEQPRRTFAAIHRYLVASTDFYGLSTPTDVHPSARVHSSAVIDPIDVRIGPNCVVGPNVTISGRVTLDAGVIVDAGATLGAAGFQTAHDDLGDDELPHVGGLRIGDGARVFAGAVIARGVFGEETVIGARCRIGNNAFVSHACVIGRGTHIGHGAVVNGHVHVDEQCWIGPGATIANDVRIGARCTVSLGSTVIRDVATGSRVTGAVAVDHWAMMRATAAIERRREPRGRW